MKFFEVFKAGTYPQGDFSEDDVVALAKNYDPKFCEAPITLDHEQRGPAYGWVKELKAEDGKLKASFRDISPELKDLVQSGKYKKISVEIYKNLEGIGPYLKSITFLGAAIPQVKGMEPVEFKDGESEIYIFEVEEEETIKPQKPDNKTEPKVEFETVKEIIKLQNHISEIESRIACMINQPDKDDKQITSLQEKVQQLSAQMKEFENEFQKPPEMEAPSFFDNQSKKRVPASAFVTPASLFEATETARQETEKELSDLKLKIKKNEFEQFLSEQITSGNLTPAQKDMSLKLFIALDNTEDSDYIEEFKSFIKTLPRQVELGEIATKKTQQTGEKEFIDFDDASEDSIAVYKEARHLAEKENISLKDALLKLYE